MKKNPIVTWILTHYGSVVDEWNVDRVQGSIIVGRGETFGEQWGRWGQTQVEISGKQKNIETLSDNAGGNLWPRKQKNIETDSENAGGNLWATEKHWNIIRYNKWKSLENRKTLT